MKFLEEFIRNGTQYQGFDLFNYLFPYATAGVIIVFSVLLLKEGIIKLWKKWRTTKNE